MKVVHATSLSVDSLTIADAPRSEPGRGDLLIRIRAASLNYRDYAVLSAGHVSDISLPFVPLSDACGTVEAVGEDVTRFRPGDRVLPCYIQGWHDGALTPRERNRTLGGPLQGVLREYFVVPAEDAVAAPAYLTDQEASTLPIAALTAWSVLQQGGIKAGDTVLIQGTGGVALFALQFARAAGALVVALTSSAEKASMLSRMGAAEVIDYRKNPSWAGAVRAANGGRGADIVVETTGASLSQSLKAVAFAGFIGAVGFLGGRQAPLELRDLIMPTVRMHGVVVGSRAGFEAMCRAMALHQIRPVIDRVFPMTEVRSAYQHLARAAHVGKIVIDVPRTA